MKRIGLLTLNPHMYNYGGFLQEMAMCKTVNDMGYECEIINFDPAQELNTFSMKRGIRYFSLSKVFEHKSRTNPCSDDKVKEASQIRKKAFDEYREKFLKLSKPLSHEELYKNELPYDIVVCGSDQIWNPQYNIHPFFLDFARDNQRKVIYAASIGKEQLTSLQLKTYSKMMENLDFISVREKSALDLLSPVSKKNIKLVLDPTLLLKEADWCEIAKTSEKNYSKYVFAYFLDLTEEKITVAKRYANEKHLNLIMVPYLHDRNDISDISKDILLDSNVNPADFLKLIMDAECILTDSFHASVFSLIFEKKFWVFGRNSGNYNMNTRLDTLLGYYEASERMIRPEDLFIQQDKALQFSYDKVNNMKKVSMEFLKNAFI